MSSFIFLIFVIGVALFFIKGKEAVVFLPIILYLFDFGFKFMPTMSLVTYLKFAILLLPLVLYNNKLFNTPFKFFFLFFYFTMFIYLFTDEYFVSAKNLTKVLLAMFFLPMGFVSNIRLKDLNLSIKIVVLLSFIGSIIGYIFGIGKIEFYGQEEEAMGLVEGAAFYPAAIGILIIYHLYVSKGFKNIFTKYFWIILGSTTFILILLTLRRTAIILPIAGILTYMYFSKKIGKAANFIVVSSLVIILTLPLYEDVFLRRLNVRAEMGRFESNFYESEMRYITTVNTFEEIFSFKNPMKSFFGENVFAGGWEKGVAQRMYHADHNQLLNTTGIIGTLLYLFIFYDIIILIRRNAHSKNIVYRNIVLSLLAILFIISLNGSIFITTFRAIIFLFIGRYLKEMQFVKWKNSQILINEN